MLLTLRKETNHFKSQNETNKAWKGDFIAFSIQTGPFTMLSAIFVLIIFQLFPFHTGELILITPEGQLWEKGIHPTPKLNETEGYQCLGYSNWIICSQLSPF